MTARRSWMSLGILATAATTLLAVAPAASATVFQGHVDGGPSSGPASRSLTGLDITYDDAAGHLVGSATFAAPPSSGAAASLVVSLGTPSGSNCGPPQAIIGAELDGGTSATALVAPSTAELPASQGYSGNTVTLSAAVAPLRALPFRCIYARVGAADSTVLSETNGWQLVVAQAPPPAPPAPAPPAPPPPAPAPVAPAPQPKPKKPRVKKVAKLGVSVSGIPKVAKRKRWITARIRVSNTGNATARGVRLTLAKVRGVSRKLPRTMSWKTLKAGSRKTVKVRLRRTATRSRTVRLTAKGRPKLKATASIKLLSKAPKAKRSKKGKKAPAPAKGPLAGRYFWGFKSHVDYAWDNYGAYFVDGEWAYRGLPGGGLPNCTKESAVLDDKGQPTGEGCFRYAYDPGSGNLTVGQYQGTFKDGKLVLDGIAMSPLSIPGPGTRYQVALTHRGFRGLCGLIGGCTTFFESLILTNDGQFARTSSSLSTLGDGYSSPFLAVGSYPPDQHGTYEILAAGQIRFAYADGTTKVQTIGIERNGAGADDPAGEGMLLDDTNFYKDSD